MKKILLASACLLTLTACSMPNQHKQETSPSKIRVKARLKKKRRRQKLFLIKLMSIILIQSNFSILKTRSYLSSSFPARPSLKKIKK